MAHDHAHMSAGKSKRRLAVVLDLTTLHLVAKVISGLWAAEAEGAKFWMQVVTELKNRGVSDIFIACVDGLKGFRARFCSH